jgi:hypothetical protein
MLKFLRGLLAVILFSALPLIAESVHQGSVQSAFLIQGGTLFTLTSGGPSGPCYLGNGFCWDSGSKFILHKVGGLGLCSSVCNFDGTVESVLNTSLGGVCTQISFEISNATLQVNSSYRTGLHAWYTQTSCSLPSVFMGGGSLLVYR